MTKKQKVELAEACLQAKKDFYFAVQAFDTANDNVIKKMAALRKMQRKVEAAQQLKTNLELRMIEASRKYRDLRAKLV